MINLLPAEQQREIRAARTNVRLINYILILLLAGGFLALISVGGYVILTSTQQAAQRSIDVSTSQTNGQYALLQQQVAALSASVANAKTVLASSTSYAKILTGIAAVLPNGVVLDSIALTPTTFGTPMALQAYAKTTADAVNLKQNLQSSPLFSNVSLNSLDPTGGDTASGYPVGVSFTVSINKGAGS